MEITKEQLLNDLYYAFVCAKKHKSSKSYVKRFEKRLNSNLIKLCDELLERRYKPEPSVCFVVSEPKKREIFAANFRDRIVHHLYYNYTYELFNRTFIEDSYSCRIGKGTHYGINRLSKHVRKESENYTKETYVLKMDIKGYFIHINRVKLLELVNASLEKMRYRKILSDDVTKSYDDVCDFDLLKYLSEVIILLNPIENCILKSNRREWNSLPKSKSLFYSGNDCGLPIGNLTSQLFSNVYLNGLDQFVKRELKCKHYGRYVDDFYVVSQDKEFLKDASLKIEKYLKENLFLDIQPKKTIIINIKYGIDFLGGFVKPYRTYLSNKTLKRAKKNIYNFRTIFERCGEVTRNVECMVNSYCGMFSHYHSKRIRAEMFKKAKVFRVFGFFIGDYQKFVLFSNKKSKLLCIYGNDTKKKPQIFTLWDELHQPRFSIFFLMVSGFAWPTERTKYFSEK